MNKHKSIQNNNSKKLKILLSLLCIFIYVYSHKNNTLLLLQKLLTSFRKETVFFTNDFNPGKTKYVTSGISWSGQISNGLERK